MKWLLEVRNLSKEFPGLRAVDGISFGIRPGICFGLLGPNGAGKTTTIEMIEGILTPSGGEILYCDRPRSADFRQQAGIQFQNTALMDYLSVREILELFASFYRDPLPLEALIERCALGEFEHRYATRLSGGQRQRLLLALALLNQPRILFLDEPTTGLDPQARRRFWDLIEAIKRDGTTIVLTTHYMDEAQQLCDELVIIDRGRIIDQGSPEALLRRHFDDTCIRLPIERYPQLPPSLQQQCGRFDAHLELRTRNLHACLAELLQAGLDLSGLKIHPPTLEDLFLKLTGRQLRED